MDADPGAIDARRVRRRADRAARTYLAAARLEAEIGSRMLERLDYVRLQPHRILDAGSGPPQRALGRRYPSAQVVAVDFSLGMLRAAPRGWPLLGPPAPARVCADLRALPLQAGSVHLAWSNMALHWVPDPLRALRDLHRVLAAEGLVMFSTLGPDTLRELRDAQAGRVHAFIDMHDWGDMLVEAGFSAPVMDVERLTLVYRDGDSVLSDLRRSGQVHAQGRGEPGLRGRRFRGALSQALLSLRRGDGLPLSFEVIYGHAWKGAPRKTADGRAVVKLERGALERKR